MRACTVEHVEGRNAIHQVDPGDLANRLWDLGGTVGVAAASSGCKTAGQQDNYVIRQNVTNSLIQSGWIKQTVYFCWSVAGEFTTWSPNAPSKSMSGVVSITVKSRNDHDLLINTYDRSMETQWKATTLRCDHTLVQETQTDNDAGLVKRLWRIGAVDVCAFEYAQWTSHTSI